MIDNIVNVSCYSHCLTYHTDLSLPELVGKLVDGPTAASPGSHYHQLEIPLGRQGTALQGDNITSGLDLLCHLPGRGSCSDSG